MSSIGDSPRPILPSYALLFFALLTFGVTWSVIGGYIYFPEQAAATFGEISGSHPLYFLATWAPGIAGILLLLAFGGLRGLRAFLSRLLLWRCAPVWWAFILIGIPLVFVAGSLIKGGPLLAPVPPEGVGAMVALMFMMLFLGRWRNSGGAGSRNRSCSVMWHRSGPERSSERPGASGIFLRSIWRVSSTRTGPSFRSSSATSLWPF
jgi:hypothetical protein